MKENIKTLNFNLNLKLSIFLSNKWRFHWNLIDKKFTEEIFNF